MPQSPVQKAQARVEQEKAPVVTTPPPSKPVVQAKAKAPVAAQQPKPPTIPTLNIPKPPAAVPTIQSPKLPAPVDTSKADEAAAAAARKKAEAAAKQERLRLEREEAKRRADEEKRMAAEAKQRAEQEKREAKQKEQEEARRRVAEAKKAAAEQRQLEMQQKLEQQQAAAEQRKREQEAAREAAAEKKKQEVEDRRVAMAEAKRIQEEQRKAAQEKKRQEAEKRKAEIAAKIQAASKSKSSAPRPSFSLPKLDFGSASRPKLEPPKPDATAKPVAPVRKNPTITLSSLLGASEKSQEDPSVDPKADLSRTKPRPSLQLTQLAKEKEAEKALEKVKDMSPRKTLSLTDIFGGFGGGGDATSSTPTRGGTKAVTGTQKPKPAPAAPARPTVPIAKTAPAKAVVTATAPRGVPTFKSWRKNRDNSVTGLISGSPAFEDGERITTSPIARGDIAKGQVVTTNSGSRYFLS